jgi:hypothetical protein
MEVSGQLHALTTLPSGKNDGTHCTGGWVDTRASWDSSGEEKISSLPVCKPPTIQSVASCCMDYAILAPIVRCYASDEF